jgi:hypothetical protein
MTGRRRTESGRPATNIRFNTATPIEASVCWAAKLRARSLGPISALYLPPGSLSRMGDQTCQGLPALSVDVAEISQPKDFHDIASLGLTSED